MIPVVWHTYTPGENPRDKWDAGLLELLFDGDLWRTPGHRQFEHTTDMPATGGAVVIFPAGIHRDITHDQLNADLAPLDWVLLVLTADEGSLFEHKHIHHPNLRLWVMTPRPGYDYPPRTRFLGEGYALDTREILATSDHDARNQDAFFAGQITHTRRRAMIACLKNSMDSVQTQGFAQGLDRADYLAAMADTKVAPCPAGPVTADSFRLFEALEAGCQPIAEDVCDAHTEPGYWDLVLPGHPFPTVDNWNNTATLVSALVDQWPGNANRTFSWWQAHKRKMAYWLADDLDELGAPPADTVDLDDQITVLVPTSPIPSHPSTAIIETTVASVRAYLPHAEIIITIDGIRPEQEPRRADYEEYTRRLLWLCNHDWRNVLPVVHDQLTHQSGMAQAALELVRTPLVFYVEHDLPLMGEVPLEAFAAALADGTADQIHLTVNTALEPAHAHLMMDDEPQMVHGARMMRTVQWCNQPYLTTTAYFRDILTRWFSPGEPTYIEWRMHSVCAGQWHKEGPIAWFRNRLWIYAPEGDMQRCYHLDGRAGDPVYDA